MNFEEFERRYKQKMEARGYVFGVDLEEDQILRDQMSGIYLGLSVYAEYQNEHAKKEMDRQKKAHEEWVKTNVPSIILPGMGH